MIPSPLARDIRMASILPGWEGKFPDLTLTRLSLLGYAPDSTGISTSTNPAVATSHTSVRATGIPNAYSGT